MNNLCGRIDRFPFIGLFFFLMVFTVFPTIFPVFASADHVCSGKRGCERIRFSDEAYDILPHFDISQGVPRSEMIVRICGIDREIVQDIARMKLTVERRYGDCVEVRVRGKQHVMMEEFLRSRGLECTIDIIEEDTSRMVERSLGPEGRGTYHEYDDLLAEMIQLAADYSEIARLDTLGESRQGRKILCMKVSDNVCEDEAEPEIMLDGATHGDEWITEEVVLFMIHHLLENYGTDPEITDLVDTRETFLVPMVNPDGVTARSRYNNAGVDLNRDYGYNWEGWGGSTSPFSQPELKAMWSLHHDHQYVLCVSYHSGTQYISLPWSYHPDATMDDDHYRHISAEYSSTSGYPYGQGYHVMYEIHGSSKDTFYGCVGALGWTIEVSYTKTPPSNQIEYYCENNREGMLSLLVAAGKGVQGVVRDGDSGEPLQAIVNVLEIDWPVFTDPVVGDYHKFLLPGTYTLHVSAPGHKTRTIEGVIVTDGPATQVDVTLEPDDSGAFAYRTISCYIADPQDVHANHSLTPWSLGFPDNVSLSIGVDGWIVQDLGAGYEVVNGPGYDFIVYEGDTSPEGYSVYGGNDCHGPWYYIGEGTGTAEFDLSESVLNEARYLKIVDDGDGNPNEQYAGMELDAIVVSTQPEGICLVFEESLLDDSLGGNGNSLAEKGEMVDIHVTLTNSGLGDAYGVYAILSSGDPYVTVRRDSSYFGDIGSEESVQSGRSYKVKIAEDCPDPHYPVLDCAIFATPNYSSEDSFVVAIGSPGFADDIEGSVIEWNHYAVTPGYVDEWHVSELRSHSETHAWKCGDTGWNNYSDYCDSGLETPAMLIAPDATLRFWHWIDAEIENSEWAWDGGIVEITTDGGASWNQLIPEGGYPYKIMDNPDSPFPAGTPCYSGSYDWSEAVFDLGAVSGDARIRFRFGADGYVSQEGWFIDDIEVDVPAPDVSGDLVQDSDLVRRGESLGYDVKLKNTTQEAHTVTVHTELTLPNGHPYPGNPVLGPYTIRLGAGKGGSRHFSEAIPHIAPLGFYSYKIVVKKGAEEIDCDAFQFEVIQGE
jgi:carboxypeptidase D